MIKGQPRWRGDGRELYYRYAQIAKYVPFIMLGFRHQSRIWSTTHGEELVQAFLGVGPCGSAAGQPGVAEQGGEFGEGSGTRAILGDNLSR
jgi:hypothetical protein